MVHRSLCGSELYKTKSIQNKLLTFSKFTRFSLFFKPREQMTMHIKRVFLRIIFIEHALLLIELKFVVHFQVLKHKSAQRRIAFTKVGHLLLKGRLFF